MGLRIAEVARRGTGPRKQAAAQSVHLTDIQPNSSFPGNQRSCGRCTGTMGAKCCSYTHSLTGADSMSAAQLDHYTRSFHNIDRDGTGSIDAEELTAALREMGQYPSSAEVECMIRTVDFDEYLELVGQIEAEEIKPETELEQIFRVLDHNGSDTISFRTLTKFLERILEASEAAALEQLVLQADEDGSGMINQSEFVAIFKDNLRDKTQRASMHRSRSFQGQLESPNCETSEQEDEASHSEDEDNAATPNTPVQKMFTGINLAPIATDVDSSGNVSYRHSV